MLDVLDRKILSSLEHTARKPAIVIARELMTSQQVISYRLKNLEKKGVIGEYYTAIDFTVFGYTSYRTLLRIKDVSEERKSKFIDFLQSFSNVLWFVECGNKWDYILNIMAKSIIEYDLLFEELRNAFPDLIDDFAVVVTVKLRYFGRDYFSGKKRATQQFHSLGEQSEQKFVDKTDKKILSLLARNARMRSLEIAKKTGVSAATVIQRMKDLEKRKIIQSYKPFIHLEKTQFRCYKALLTLHHLSPAIENKIDSYLAADSRVVGYLKMVGPWNFEIEFEVNADEEMLSLTRKFREKFKDVIKDFEILPLYHEYFYNYFPSTFMEKNYIYKRNKLSL